MENYSKVINSKRSLIVLLSFLFLVALVIITVLLLNNTKSTTTNSKAAVVTSCVNLFTPNSVLGYGNLRVNSIDNINIKSIHNDKYNVDLCVPSTQEGCDTMYGNHTTTYGMHGVTVGTLSTFINSCFPKLGYCKVRIDTNSPDPDFFYRIIERTNLFDVITPPNTIIENQECQPKNQAACDKLYSQFGTFGDTFGVRKYQTSPLVPNTGLNCGRFTSLAECQTAYPNVSVQYVKDLDPNNSYGTCIHTPTAAVCEPTGESINSTIKGNEITYDVAVSSYINDIKDVTPGITNLGSIVISLPQNVKYTAGTISSIKPSNAIIKDPVIDTFKDPVSQSSTSPIKQTLVWSNVTNSNTPGYLSVSLVRGSNDVLNSTLKFSFKATLINDEKGSTLGNTNTLFMDIDVQQQDPSCGISTIPGFMTLPASVEPTACSNATISCPSGSTKINTNPSGCANFVCVTNTPAPTAVTSSCLCGSDNICGNSCSFDQIKGTSYGNQGNGKIICSRENGLGPTPSQAEKDAYCNPKSGKTTSQRTLGDADNDGVVNQLDYINYVRAVNGGTIPPNINPDFNGDGVVSPSDRAIVVSTLLLQKKK